MNLSTGVMIHESWFLMEFYCCFLMMKVAIHYYGRLAAKQGWRFDSTYDHKDETGESVPFVFVLGSGKVNNFLCQCCV